VLASSETPAFSTDPYDRKTATHRVRGRKLRGARRLRRHHGDAQDGKTDWVNNFWKVLAHDPPTLRRIWANIKEVMGPGTLSPLTKELLYVAVSVSNG
jgi:hypothetical protein